MKACKDCLFYSSCGAWIEACSNPDVNGKDPITGDYPRFTYQMVSCRTARGYNDLCGRDAKHWKAKTEEVAA